MHDHLPRFSVIVPTRERRRQLHSCLQSLAGLEYPRHLLDVVVVDDGSTTDLQPAVDAVAGQLEVTLVRQAHAGPAAARNLGASHCRGRFLAFTDDDCCPEPDWLLVLAERFGLDATCALGGQTLNRLVDNPYSVASQVIHDAVYRHYNADPQQARFLNSNNLALPADTFRALSGFDSRNFRAASEDRDLCDRWRWSGRRLVYVPQAVIYHAHELDLRQFVRQHWRYGQGAYHFHQARARRGSGRLRDEFGFHMHLRQLLRPSFEQLPRGQALRMALLLLVWQASNASGYAWERLRHWSGESEELPA